MLKAMSGLEQHLYFHLAEHDKRVFTIHDITTTLNITPAHARNIAANMVTKNVAERVKPGLFVRTPESVILDKQHYTEDAILIAAKATQHAFLSHYTALTIHGLAERYTTHLYATTTKHQRPIHYHTITITYLQTLPTKYFGATTIPYSHEHIQVADIERTLIDSITTPTYTGGWTETIHCLKNIDTINYTKLITYLQKYQNKTTTRKIGYLLHHLTNLSPPPHILHKIQTLSGNNELYFDTTKKGRYDATWHLIIPKHITEILHADKKTL